MRLARPARLTVATVACLSLLSLAACSDGESPDQAGDTPASSSSSEEPAETPAESPSDSPSEDPVDDAGSESGSGEHPDWALPPTTGGERISSFEVGDVSIEVFQVGTATAPKDGMFVDPDTDKPLLAQGDPIVFVNYVITNNGEPIDLGASRVSFSARYDDWKWAQGMDSIVDDDLFEQQGVHTDALAPGAYNEEGVYTFGSGQTYSVGDNFVHQPGSPITFEATIVPVDAEGELIHDQRMEGTGTGTIA